MQLRDVSMLLNDKKRSLNDVYLELQIAAEDVYGPNTVVIMEVGSFFEVYGVDNEQETIGKPKEIADILNLQLTRRNKAIPENSRDNPLLAGFPTQTFDRYISRLVQEQIYTIVIVRQRGTPPKIERYIDRILSPGIHFDYQKHDQGVYVATLLVDEHSEQTSIGAAVVDVSTGDTIVFEAHSRSEDPTYALDEAYAFFQTYAIAEYLLVPLCDTIDIDMIKQYLQLQGDSVVHIRDKRASIIFQNELFSRMYEVDSFLSPIEFFNLETLPMASEALAITFDFIIEHDEDALQSFHPPTIHTQTKQLYLGNNPLHQLQIISHDPHEMTVLSYLDNTTTSIGKRLLKERLLHPIVDSTQLQIRYDMVELVKPHIDQLRGLLKQVYDIARIERRLAVGRLHPLEINFLRDTLLATQHIHTLLAEKTPQQAPNVEAADIARTLDQLERTFDFNQTQKVLQGNICTSVFVPGVHPQIDSYVATLATKEAHLETIAQTLARAIAQVTGKTLDEELAYIHTRQLDKEGHYFSLTKSRFSVAQSVIAEQFVSLDEEVFACKDFSYKVQKSNVKVSGTIIDQISDSIVTTQQKLIGLVKEVYQEELQHLHQLCKETLRSVQAYVAAVDVAVSTARVAQEYHLVQPVILPQQAEHSERILELVEVRHPLVERLEAYGLYVPNTVALGDSDGLTVQSVFQQEAIADVRGALVYGINSSGKSSLMKSIGIAVIMAQAGFYVAATSMRFTLCHELFTRIVAQDNFSKGLSSFGVEMMELKNIFNRATQNSLILGDEISHGTETYSAIAIVSAAITRLVEIGALFMFTTHLHQLKDIAQVQSLPSVKSVHLAVHYDGDDDVLYFDRTLQAGSGSSIYGLEFAQSLHIDKNFLQTALEIRKELTGDYTELERLAKQQQSLYNKDVLMTVCLVCGEKAHETHHIQPQQLADSHGFIGHMHKDHKFNLLPICEECHDKIHRHELVVEGFIMTNKGPKLQIRSDKQPRI